MKRLGANILGLSLIVLVWLIITAFTGSDKWMNNAGFWSAFTTGLICFLISTFIVNWIAKPSKRY